MPYSLKPFEPVGGGTLKPSVSTTATDVSGTSGNLPNDATQIVITNTDAAIIVFVRASPADAGVVAVVDADQPVLPNQQIRISCPTPGKYSIVAASGTPVVYVTPGKGN